MKLHPGTLAWLIEARTRIYAAVDALDALPRQFERCGTPLLTDAEYRQYMDDLILRSKWRRSDTNTPEDPELDPARVFVICRALHDLQPLYLIPPLPANRLRIAAQAWLISALLSYYYASTQLHRVDWEKVGPSRLPSFPDSLDEFAAYLSNELNLAREAGVLPLGAEVDLHAS